MSVRLVITDEQNLQEACRMIDLLQGSKLGVSIDLNSVSAGRLGQLYKVARCTKQEQVVVKKVFSTPQNLRKFLKALSANQDAMNLHLDISENAFDPSCAREIGKMLRKGMIKFLFLPTELQETDVERILSAINASKSTLETLDVSGTFLSARSLDLLEQILQKKKIKNTLILRGCSCPLLSIKSAKKLLLEMSRIIVEPGNVSLSWAGADEPYHVTDPEHRKHSVKEQNAESKAFQETTDAPPRTPSIDSGLGGSTQSVSSISPNSPVSNAKSLLSIPSTFGKLVSRKEFDSTQSLPSPVRSPTKLSPRPYPTFKADFDEGSLQPLESGVEIFNQDSEGQTVLSSSFSANIGPAGGEIIAFDCCITFPKGSFDKKTKVIGKLEIDPSRCPVDYVPVTPFLKLESTRRSLKPVSIKMMSWCIHEGGNRDDQVLDVLHFSDDWETWDVMVTMPFKSVTEYEFETPTYSGFLIALRKCLLGPQTYLIEGSLFADDNANFTLLFHLRSSFLMQFFSQNKALECRGERRVQFDTLKAKLDDHVVGAMLANNVAFANNGRLSFIVDNDFVATQSWRKLQTCLVEDQPVKRPLIISCNVRLNDRIVQDNCTFRYSEPKDGKRVYVHSKKVFATTVAMDSAQITFPSRCARYIETFRDYLGVVVLLLLWYFLYRQ